MIVETCLAIGQFDFRHVATCATILLNWTRSGFSLTVLGSGCTLKRVARQTLHVISSSVRNQIIMGFMAGNTTDARIGSAEAFALC
jgi:hypothetical protein